MASLATHRRASAVRKQHKSVLVCKPTSGAKAKAVVAKAHKDHVAKVGGAVARVHAAATHATPSATASPHAKAQAHAKAHAKESAKAKAKAGARLSAANRSPKARARDSARMKALDRSPKARARDSATAKREAKIRDKRKGC
jgi:hypothetical protein